MWQLVLLGTAVVGLGSLTTPAAAQVTFGSPADGAQEARIVYLTLENMVEMAMSSSFTVRRLTLEVEREQQNLKGQRARLKSRVDLDLTIPAFRLTSEPKWNADLQKNEIIQEHTRRWEGEISIRQPVILFGFPTDGYLSINNRMYRYNQIDDEGTSSVTYYNRYYISYSQPLFQPNGLKNDLEQAELSLEESELDFYDDVMGIVAEVSEGYYSLLDEYYGRIIARDLVARLERALDIAHTLVQNDSARGMEVDQIQVELANAREQLQAQESSIRSTETLVRQEFGLSQRDSLVYEPEFLMDPVPIDMDDAIRFARDLTPRMRQLDIDLRNQEIRLDRTRSRGAFRMNVNMSYGRERRDEYFDHLWVEPDNSYTINVTAYLPIWDWGERKARVAAGEIGLEQTRLRMEEAELQLVSGARNEVLNVRDREERTLSMRENLELAREVSETNFRRYEEGRITALDLLLSLRREADTAENFLEAYVSWKESLTRLQEQTFYSFERGQPMLDWLRQQGWVPESGIGGGDWGPRIGTGVGR